MMNSTQSYKRYPAVKCWIQHLTEGQYLNEEKAIFTIFGKLKRVRLIATIHDKREILLNQADDDLLYQEEGKATHRLEFDLEDGTGQIRANLWRVNPENYEEYQKGDIVDIIGIIREYKGFLSISPEILRKIENPNMILLRDAEIIKRIKTDKLFEIPDSTQEDFDLEDLSEKIDVDSLFEEQKDDKTNEIKDRIFSEIEEGTLEGNGVRFQELLKSIGIPEKELRKYIRDLEMESKIYPSEEDLFQTY